jgi:hypothetical protein
LICIKVRRRSSDKVASTKEESIMTKAAILAGGALLVLLACPATAQVNHLMVPQSIRYEHNAVIERLTKEAARPGVASAVAQRLLVLVKAHFTKEEEFVFPPLGLLDQIEAGEMPTDPVRKAAIEMAARTEAAKDDLEQEHVQIFSMTQELIQYATRASEPELKSFASDLAAHSLQETEILQPTTIMIGKYLQAKSPPSQ